MWFNLITKRRHDPTGKLSFVVALAIMNSSIKDADIPKGSIAYRLDRPYQDPFFVKPISTIPGNTPQPLF